MSLKWISRSILLLLAGLAAASGPVLAGSWVPDPQYGHEAIFGGSATYSFSNGSNGTVFPVEDQDFRVSVGVGTVYGGAIISNDCIAELRLVWSPTGDIQSDPPPSEVWVEIKTGCSWGAMKSMFADVNSFTLEGFAMNPCGGVYTTSFSGSQDTFHGSSTGSKYVKLSGSSGVLSVGVMFNMGVGVSCISSSLKGLSLTAYANIDPMSSPPTPAQREPIVPHESNDSHYPNAPTGFCPQNGATKFGSDPIDLASGAHMYLTQPDIVSYNPYGPSAVFERNYLSLRAEEPYASPGLSTGWVSNYDVRIDPNDMESWDELHLIYPNGASEDIMPVLDSGDPTGEFIEDAGAPYYVTGVASETTGEWDSITITWKHGVKWTFELTDDDYYSLNRITNNMGRYISILRDSGNDYRVTSVTDDSGTPNTLMTFTYSGNYLSSVTDAYSRKVVYTFGSAAGTTCLLTVSQIAASSEGSPAASEQYGYTSISSQPHMTTFSVPSPTGSGTSTSTLTYDTETLKVSSFVDANGNQLLYTYDPYNGRTTIQAKDSQNELVKEWTECFDVNKNVSIGSMDANYYMNSLLYGDDGNPNKPTSIVDKEGRFTNISYNDYGNIVSITDPRGTSVVSTYSYANFTLGRLESIQEGDKEETSYTYYEPSGLVHTVTTPRPGGGEPATVTTTYTYDSLGNVLTVVAPGNSTDETITTTYNYTTDGEYGQEAKLGQPLTITDNLGNVTHFRYDSRGNMTSKWDDLGNRYDYTYNLADQLVSTILPDVD